MADETTTTQDAEPTVEAYTDDAGRTCLMLDAGAEPPSEFRILAAGTTRTTKGPILFDDAAGTAVSAAFADHDRADLPIDYNHGMLAEIKTADSGKAAGWFVPVVRTGELWASQVEWTPAAATAIREREYRHFSPALDIERKSNRAMRLINVALTNLPATKGQRPLVASDDTQTGGAAVPTGDQPMSDLLKLLGADDEAAAIVALADRDAATVTLTAERDSLVTKLAEAVAQTATLAEQVATLTAEKVTAAREQLIAELSEAGKLPPALHDWARGISFEALSEFGAKVPGSDKPAPAQPSVAAVTLSDEDKEIARAAHQTEAEFLAHKAQLSAAR
jgi:phage I-like protein